MRLELENLGQGKLEKLRKLTSDLLKKRKKRDRRNKYGNINKGFTDSELERFLSSCKHPKAYLAFYLMSHLGFRVSEVVKIKKEDIDWVNNKIRVSTLKARTGDFMFMPKRVRKLLLNWVQKFPKEIEDNKGFVLFSENPTYPRWHISSDWLRNEFRNTCMLCNLDEWYDYAEDGPNKAQKNDRKLHRLTTHSLRHYFITKCYNHTQNPVLTQKLARHTAFKSTQTYINVDFEKLSKVVEEVFEPETTKEKDELVEFLEVYGRFREMKNTNPY